MQIVHKSKPVVPRDRFLRLAEVESLIGCKKSTIYTMIKEGTFPKPARFTARMVVWPETVVMQWIQDCIKESTAKASPQPAHHD